ncbi:MAG: ribonuclease III [Oscillospiraceae bacterium]|nr:ribonuclease III [Oscillospiraceae bacterium]
MELEQRIGYTFKNTQLLDRALTHSSWANENKARGAKSNERLEFLGDSVLGFIVAEHLFLTNRDMPEGQLTKLRALIVCEQSLARTARELGLGAKLKMGRGEEKNGGRDRDSIIADAVEALIAAIYLDGGRQCAEEFVHKFIISAPLVNDKDCKTILQEFIQQTKDRAISYELIDQSGPDHNKRFVMQVRIDSEPCGVGEGRTKQSAQQEAARMALQKLAPELL